MLIEFLSTLQPVLTTIAPATALCTRFLLTRPATTKVPSKMKPNYTALRKLTDKSKGIRLKVKVTHKGPPTVSPSKRRYQRLVLRDEEGTTVKATLFEEDIDTYAEALKRNGEYELSDVTMRALPSAFQTRPNKAYQLTLGGRMKVRALNVAACDEAPNYQFLDQIPKSLREGESLLDIAAVVLFVGDKREEKQDGYTRPVREILLADQSSARPVKLLAKNRLAHDDAAPFLTTWHETFLIIGFKGVRASSYGGLHLATTLSSEIETEPAGMVPNSVAEWVKDNMALLDDWRAKVVLLYSGSDPKTVTPISCILAKKATTIWQDEVFWINASLPSLTDKDVWVYDACDLCGEKTAGEIGVCFKCQACGAENVPLEKKIVMTATLSDATGTVKASIYSAMAEKIFGISASAFDGLRKKGEPTVTGFFEDVSQQRFLIKISPNHELSTSNVLKWVVGTVEPANTALPDPAVVSTDIASNPDKSKADPQLKLVPDASDTDNSGPDNEALKLLPETSKKSDTLSATSTPPSAVGSGKLRNTKVEANPKKRKAAAIKLNFNNTSYAGLEDKQGNAEEEGGQTVENLLPGESQLPDGQEADDFGLGN